MQLETATRQLVNVSSASTTPTALGASDVCLVSTETPWPCRRAIAGPVDATTLALTLRSKKPDRPTTRPSRANQMASVDASRTSMVACAIAAWMDTSTSTPATAVNPVIAT